MVSEAKLKAQYKYDKNNTQQIVLKLNKKNDSDILMKFEDIDNRQGYIKQLIRQDLRCDGLVLSLDSIKCLVQPTAKKYSIDKIYIFGSYARGEATNESDIDIMIDGGNYRGLTEYYDMIESFSNAFGKKVDLVTRSSLTEKSKISSKRLLDNIEREGILVYEN